MRRTLLCILTCTACCAGAGRVARGDDMGYGTAGDQRLFYNYYTEPGSTPLGAQLYVAPRPTPPLVGHTYYTYPPLLPHEYLYTHHRTYKHTNPDGRTTRVRVRYGHTCLNQVWRPSPRPVQKTKVDVTNTHPWLGNYWRVNPAYWNAGYYQ